MIPNVPIAFTVGSIAGIAMATFSAPIPVPSKTCETYKVSNKVVTSYVLKPPYVAPEIIHEKCPVVLKNDEKVNTSDEPVSETNTSETPRHRRHHRRHRRYW